MEVQHREMQLSQDGRENFGRMTPEPVNKGPSAMEEFRFILLEFIVSHRGTLRPSGHEKNEWL